MPTTAALLIGVLLGTYVVAPIVDSGTTTAQGVGAPARGIAAAGSSRTGRVGDRQLAELVSYLRGQFAPGKPAWTGIPTAISRIRQGISR